MEQAGMVIHEDIVIAGAGIAGLTTALGLHRLGIRSLVLEASDSLRITGFALTIWTNAWRALDAVGIGDTLRTKSLPIRGFQANPADSNPSKETNITLRGDSEGHCVRRKDLLETLESELPGGTIRYSSKIVSIDESGQFKLLHIADGTLVKAKVLIGCDGVNSMVAKWLGLQNPIYSGRSAIRGFVEYPNSHGFEEKFHTYFGGGVRFGFIPVDDKSLYWFCTFTPSVFTCDENEQDPLRMKQFVLMSIHNVMNVVKDIVESTKLDCISCAPLRFRLPWNILLGNIVKNNVCVAGDAFHPMTPDIGQGGCSALEDSVILARCLGEALLAKPTGNEMEKDDVYVKMERGLQRYAKERKFRSFSLIATAYLIGTIQQSNNKVMNFFRKNFLTRYTFRIMLWMTDFDCGKLSIASGERRT